MSQKKISKETVLSVQAANGMLEDLLAGSDWTPDECDELEVRQASSGKIPGRTVDIRQFRGADGLPVRNTIQVFRRYKGGRYIENQIAWNPRTETIQGSIEIGETVLKSLIEA